jgi:hypothetical protein
MIRILALLILLLAAVGDASVTTVPPGGLGGYPLLAPNGTQAVPSYSFSSETDLGCWRTGANSMSCATGAVLPYAVLVIGSTAQNLYIWDAGSAASGVQVLDGNTNLFADDSALQWTPGKLGFPAIVFASLGTPANGTVTYCSDCTIANPCAGSGTGALAKRLNSVWVCN